MASAARVSESKSGCRVQTILLANIRVDHDLQSRARMHFDQMQEFSRAMVEGAVFPPVDVFWDGRAYWLADGFHRHQATRNAGLKNIRATVHDGSRADAIVFSAGANQKFSIKRGPEDVRKAIRMLLQYDEWFHKNSSQIARHVGCTNKTVTDTREEFCRETNRTIPAKFESADGRMHPSFIPKKHTSNPQRFLPISLNKRVSSTIPDRHSLEYLYIRDFFVKRFGFLSLFDAGEANAYPGIKAIYREASPSILMTPCEFGLIDALPLAVGRLLMAKQLAGVGKVDRLIVVCYSDDGPEQSMKLACQLGIEFATPEELIKEFRASDAK